MTIKNVFVSIGGFVGNIAGFLGVLAVVIGSLFMSIAVPVVIAVLVLRWLGVLN